MRGLSARGVGGRPAAQPACGREAYPSRRPPGSSSRPMHARRLGAGCWMWAASARVLEEDSQRISPRYSLACRACRSGGLLPTSRASLGRPLRGSWQGRVQARLSGWRACPGPAEPHRASPGPRWGLAGALEAPREARPGGWGRAGEVSRGGAAERMVCCRAGPRAKPGPRGPPPTGPSRGLARAPPPRPATPQNEGEGARRPRWRPRRPRSWRMG